MVQRIATFNKQPFPEKEFNKVVESSRKLETNVEKSYTVLDLLRYPVLRKRSLILGLIWYVICTGSARSVPNSVIQSYNGRIVSLKLTILIYIPGGAAMVIPYCFSVTMRGNIN